MTSNSSESKGLSNLSFIGSTQIKSGGAGAILGSGDIPVAHLIDGGLVKQPLKKANTFPYQVLQNNDSSTTSYSSSADWDSHGDDAGAATQR